VTKLTPNQRKGKNKMPNKCEPNHKNLEPINKLLVVVLVIKDLILLIDVGLSKKVDDKNGAFRLMLR